MGCSETSARSPSKAYTPVPVPVIANKRPGYNNLHAYQAASAVKTNAFIHAGNSVMSSPENNNNAVIDFRQPWEDTIQPKHSDNLKRFKAFGTIEDGLEFLASMKEPAYDFILSLPDKVFERYAGYLPEQIVLDYARNSAYRRAIGKDSGKFLSFPNPLLKNPSLLSEFILQSKLSKFASFETIEEGLEFLASMKERAYDFILALPDAVFEPYAGYLPEQIVLDFARNSAYRLD
jgi:hypothetical protein